MSVINKRIGKKNISYQAIIRVKGYKTICKSFDKLSKAQDWAKKIEVQMKDGTYKEAVTFTANDFTIKIVYTKDLINYFKDNVCPQRYSYHEKYFTLYEWWIDNIGNIKVKDLTSSIISGCKQKLINEKIKKGDKEVTRSNNTINKYLMALSAILTYAVKELEIIDMNPMYRVDNMKKPEGRIRFLTEEEKIKLDAACKNHSKIIYIFYLLLLMTGARYSEALNLRVEDIDFKNYRVHYINTKNKTNRGLGITPEFVDLIQNYLIENNIKSGKIFINKNTQKPLYIKGQLEKIIKKNNIEDFHIHDFRHTFASKAAAEGASLLDIALLLGHKSLVMARRYSHLTQQHTDEIARKTAAAFNLKID